MIIFILYGLLEQQRLHAMSYCPFNKKTGKQKNKIPINISPLPRSTANGWLRNCGALLAP